MTGLKKPMDFQAVYRAHCSRANRLLVMYKRENGGMESRIGMSISKKVGNSVVRHRLKRQLKEIARLSAEEVADGYDIVLIVRNTAAGTDYHELERSYRHLIAKQRLWKEKQEYIGKRD